MAYLHVVQSLDIAPQEKQSLIREFDLLRAELNDIRAKFAAVLAKLDADVGVTDTNYVATQALAAAAFTRL